VTPTLVVLAKAPLPGRSKTRLAPAFGPLGAARLAAAALRDTLDAVAATPARRRVLALDGDLAASPLRVPVPAGFVVVPQVTGPHGARIAAALAGCDGPALLIGMDTPQVTPALLALDPDRDPDADAWLGPAADGGWWLLALRDPARHAVAALDGVPMSVPGTGAAQHERLRALGLTVRLLPVLRDVDEPADALAVAAAAPATRFAAAVRNATPALALAAPGRAG